jgi:Carboxypeptidase regulatory-like domain
MHDRNAGHIACWPCGVAPIKTVAFTLLLLTHVAVADPNPPPAVPSVPPATTLPPTPSSTPPSPSLSPPAPSSSPLLSRLSGRVVDRINGGPVEGAHVLVTDAEGTERVVITDQTGRYELDLVAGTYEVAFAYGASGPPVRISLEPERAAVLDGKVDSGLGEVIVIKERHPPKVPPKPINHRPRGNPPYSQEALDKDAWTRAWVVLDISAKGEVTRFKFLKRPGYDLEKITADEVFRLAFEPALDHDGKAVRTWLVWNLEWPSNGWLNARELTRTMAPPTICCPPRLMSERVPCKGSGPMQLHSVYPTYRDCSVPNLARMPNEPWIVKPPTQTSRATR